MKLRISASLLYVTSIILIISCANIQSAVADDANAPCTTANDNPFGFCADTTPGGVNANAWKNGSSHFGVWGVVLAWGRGLPDD